MVWPEGYQDEVTTDSHTNWNIWDGDDDDDDDGDDDNHNMLDVFGSALMHNLGTCLHQVGTCLYHWRKQTALAPSLARRATTTAGPGRDQSLPKEGRSHLYHRKQLKTWTILGAGGKMSSIPSGKHTKHYGKSQFLMGKRKAHYFYGHFQ